MSLPLCFGTGLHSAHKQDLNNVGQYWDKHRQYGGLHTVHISHHFIIAFMLKNHLLVRCKILFHMYAFLQLSPQNKRATKYFSAPLSLNSNISQFLVISQT